MDYKYINQLLDRYWQGKTSLEEEDILRAFFSQNNVPAELRRYQPLFCYEAEEARKDVLGDDFDKRILGMTEDAKTVKAKVIPLTQRLRPLFKAAAMVAIVLTLGNALQVPFAEKQQDPISGYDGYYKPELDNGTNMAYGDSTVIDTLQQSLMSPEADMAQPIIK